MDKKLYWNIHNGDSTYTMTLDGCLELIKNESEGMPENDDIEYILTPIWMTEEEFDNIPEAE